MRRAPVLLVLALCAGLAALSVGGRDAFGRVALALHLPGAAALIGDPAWRGYALARGSDWLPAARAFAAASDGAGEGRALARAGLYAEALEALDRHLALHPGDAAARADFDLIRAFYTGLAVDADAAADFFVDRDGPTVESFIARGNARAAGTGSEATNIGATMGLPEVESRGRLGVRRVFNDYFLEANQRWLRGVPDVPGEFLAERIKVESRRRADAGLAPPESADRW